MTIRIDKVGPAYKATINGLHGSVLIDVTAQIDQLIAVEADRRGRELWGEAKAARYEEMEVAIDIAMDALEEVAQ